MKTVENCKPKILCFTKIYIHSAEVQSKVRSPYCGQLWTGPQPQLALAGTPAQASLLVQIDQSVDNNN